MNVPSTYKSRSLQTELWRQRFGSASHSVFELVLCEVCNAFLFDQSSQFLFVPDDRIADIYHACHPRWKFWDWGDSLELETLTQNLEKRLGIELHEEMSDITLGEIVEMALKRQAESE